jgi:2-dehydropantoate 2-reductase
MKVAVVGAGAMGSLFGGRLAEAGEDVWLIDVWKEHVAAIQGNGLGFTEQGRTRRISVKATTNPGDPGVADLVIVFVKHNETGDAIRQAVPLMGRHTVVLSLQNGIGNIDIIRAVVPSEQVVMGLTTLTSLVRGPGHIEANFRGRGETYVWPVSGIVTDALQGAVAAMNRAGLHTEISPDVEYRIWRKLIINTSLTALSAAVPLRVRDLIAHPSGRELIEATTREVVQVAQTKGIPLKLEESIEYLYRVAEEARDHIGSMTIDITSGRKTEIEAINGAVVREGERAGVPTPANRFVYHIIRLIEDTYDVRVTGGTR